MISIYGRDRVEKMKLQKYETRKYTVPELIELEAHYKKRTQELLDKI